MGRFAFRATLACMALSSVFLTSCSSSSPTRVVPNQVPGSVSLTPSPNVSMELGKNQLFTATARNSAGNSLLETFSFESTNPAVLTVANNGFACAGIWDSLTTPVTCTPGSTGTSQVTASAGGVSSPPVTVYVHQHITNIVISRVPNQPPTLSTQCLSKRAPSGNPESVIYQAFAFSGNTDITSSVGPFTWQATALAGRSTNAVSLAALPAGSVGCASGAQGQCLNQQSAIASAPGAAFLFASASAVNSQSLQFTTCPVQSISLSALGNSATSFVVNTGSSTTLNATVTDVLGMTITGVPLTWSASNQVALRVPAAGTVSTVFGSVGTVSGSAVGAGAVTASCLPPSCNGGITPSTPIYPTQAISFDVKSTSAPAAPTVLVTSTGCLAGNPSNQSCTTRVVPITRSGTATDFLPGAPVTLPFPPNSLLFNPSGANTYLGVNSLGFGTETAVLLTGSTPSLIPNVAGKVLATSPDGSVAIFSDTSDSPNRVFICQSCSTSSSQNVSTFLFDGATAAAFSPDNIAGGFRAYVVSGKPCPGTGSAGCLLVFSKVDAPKLVPLAAPATDAAFIGNGILGYIAGGDVLGAAFLPTCDDPTIVGSIGDVALPSELIRALPDGQSALALAPPNVQKVTAQITGSTVVGVPGCPAPRGFLTVDNTVAPPSGLGVGSFTPTQFFLSPDGSTAYILGQTGSGAATARLPFIIAFNLATESPSDISLTGNAVPLSASLSPAGDLLFVGADDGSVHVINTATQLDTQQVALTFPQSSLCVGPGNPATQVETTLTLTDASQSGANTTYTYTSLAGPALQTGETVIVRGMSDPTNNGIFTIASLGSGSFTVANADGVTATAQSGAGLSGVICNPDLVAVKP
jgi:hypothetical protein